MSEHRRLIDFIAETSWKSLPEKVREKSRMALMDNVCATLSVTL